MRNALIGAVVGLAIFGAGWWWVHQDAPEGAEENPTPEIPAAVKKTEEPEAKESQGAAIGDENHVVFRCDGGKTITAVFERDIVGVTLSDGRQIVLRQAPSGSGIRYLSNDTSIELRGQGSEAQLIEDGETTHANCEASM